MDEDKNEDRGTKLTWNGLSVYARRMRMNKGLRYPSSKDRGKLIIDNVTGRVMGGSLTAIIGPSGAGKSTLISCLALRNRDSVDVVGDLRVNGRPVSVDFMRTNSGYMHQEDLFIGTLTVIEHLQFMARLRVDRRLTDTQRDRLVNQLIEDLSLSKCKETRIGGLGYGDEAQEAVVLSGGERKRLAFACECLTEPKLLFLDEPTTGLDSVSATSLVQSLSFMCKGLGGRNACTVICTVHQPSFQLLQMFNEIILVHKGRIPFAGTPDDAIQFFESQGFVCPDSYNPSEFLVKTLQQSGRGEELCDNFLGSQKFRKIEEEISHIVGKYASPTRHTLPAFDHERPRWLTRLYWLLYRSILDTTRDPKIRAYRIIQKIVVALMAGLCFNGTLNIDQKGVQSVQGALFIMVTENTFAPMYAVLAFFPTRVPLFKRELDSGICTPLQFYLSNIIAMIPGMILEPILFTMVFVWTAGLQLTGEGFLLASLVIIACINVSSSCEILPSSATIYVFEVAEEGDTGHQKISQLWSISIFFSTAFSSVPIAMAYLVPFDYCLMITSGLFIKLSTLPQYIGWVRSLSWLMYANEALTIIQWKSVPNITCETARTDLPCLKSGVEVIESFSFSPDNFWMDMASMSVLYFGFMALGFICLLLRVR